MRIPKALVWLGFDRKYFEDIPLMLKGVGILIVLSFLVSWFVYLWYH